MASPFLGELRLVAFDFPPKGWAFCGGQLLPINQNQALFALLGTTYGGNGTTTFALPDLRGRVALHQGGGFSLGQSGGEESHTLTINEGSHRHLVTQKASKDEETTNRPDGAYFTVGGPFALSADTAMGGTQTSAAGGGQPHENRQPLLALSYIIALQGIFPTQS